MLKHHFLFVGILCLAACHSASLSRMRPLLGRWATASGYCESWTATNDSTFSGFSYMMRGKDTLFSEKIALEQRKGALAYMASVSNQNEGKGVIFGYIGLKKGAWVFENKMHDFPQRICYKKIGKDSLQAWIEGTVKGEERRQDFFMKRY